MSSFPSSSYKKRVVFIDIYEDIYMPLGHRDLPCLSTVINEGTRSLEGQVGVCLFRKAESHFDWKVCMYTS